MFKRVTIELDGPICACEVENLGWTPVVEDKSFGLQIDCKTCKVSLRIPHAVFKAGFTLERAYPGTKSKAPPAPVLKLVPGAPVGGGPALDAIE